MLTVSKRPMRLSILRCTILASVSTVSVGEPKRNKDYHRAHSPKRKSDSTESLAMAGYAVVERPQASHGKPAAFAALRRVASRLKGQTKQSTRLINQLHETLSASFPELATIITDLSAGWVLLLLEKYPTNQRIAGARLSSLEKIPFIPEGMAEKLQNAAKNSVGTLDGDIAAALIEELVSAEFQYAAYNIEVLAPSTSRVPQQGENSQQTSNVRYSDVLNHRVERKETYLICGKNIVVWNSTKPRRILRIPLGLSYRC